MEKNITQLHDVTPEDLKQLILNGVAQQLEELTKQFKPKEPTKWVTRLEATKILGVTLATINNWSNKGILKRHKIGNQVRFKREEIDKVLQSSNKKASK